MGATVWQRDGQGGKTFKTGIQQNPQRPGKRKLVWKRDDQQAHNPPEVPAQRRAAPPAQPSAQPASLNGYKRPRPSKNTTPSAAHPPPAEPRSAQAAAASEDWDGEVVFDVPDSDSKDAGPPGTGNSKGQEPHANGNGSSFGARAHSNVLQGRDLYGNGGHLDDARGVSGQATTREQLERAEAERKVRAAQEELEALRRGIAEREQRLAREQREAAAWEAGQRWQRDDMARRKSRLEAGFAEAFKQAKQTAAADMAKPGRAPVSAADTAEVARVLAARDDYEVLGVQPGASSAAARRRYREMAVALHPDKCRVSKAKDAFQRLVRAYQEVTKSVV